MTCHLTFLWDTLVRCMMVSDKGWRVSLPHPITKTNQCRFIIYYSHLPLLSSHMPHTQALLFPSIHLSSLPSIPLPKWKIINRFFFFKYIISRLLTMLHYGWSRSFDLTKSFNSQVKWYTFTLIYLHCNLVPDLLQ